MDVKFYNTLTRKKETFRPLENKKVGLYTCGPTVYDRAHIGNLRTYIFEDVLKRVLIFNGYKVKHVMNITDIEDKIIKKMRAEKKSLPEITEPLIKLFFDDLQKLNIKKADSYPRATKSIKDIVRLINILFKKGFAYKGEDGSVYFKISKFKNYGRLSGLKNRRIKSGSRVSADEYGKEEAVDFALWKTAKPNEPSWPSPFGPGRPGWHIECSAMSMKNLGKSFDIHAGAVDLIFPHHENEIAQSEAATGKKFVNFWLHGNFLNFKGEKISKSKGGLYTISELEKKGFSPLAYKYLCLTTHYRKSLEFSLTTLKNSQNAYERLKNILGVLKNDGKINEKYLAEFEKAVNDDLNMPQALAVFWRLLRDRKALGKIATIHKMDKIFGLGLSKIKKVEVPGEIKKLVDRREQWRREKNWTEADKIRQSLEKNGWMVKDTNAGPEITKI